jgi:hypothetical protein
MRRAILTLALVALLAAGCGGGSGSASGSDDAQTVTGELVANGTGSAFTTPDGDILCMYVLAAQNLICAADSTQSSAGMIVGEPPYASKPPSPSDNRDFAHPTLPYDVFWKSPDGAITCMVGIKTWRDTPADAQGVLETTVLCGGEGEGFMFGKSNADGSLVRRAANTYNDPTTWSNF